MIIECSGLNVEYSIFDNQCSMFKCKKSMNEEKFDLRVKSIDNAIKITIEPI